MRMMPRARAGFTLVETLVAMLLVSAVALPSSLWLYRSRTNHAAWERFQAVQSLEQRMNRAILLRGGRDGAPDTAPGGISFELRVEDGGDSERLILGIARDRRGRVLVDLKVPLFERGGT